MEEEVAPPQLSRNSLTGLENGIAQYLRVFPFYGGGRPGEKRDRSYSIAGLMAAISQCATSFSIARRTQALHSVLDQAEIIHPMLFDKEPVDELAVSEDSGIVDGYTFTRECEEDEDEDGLYVVTSTVRSTAGGWGSTLTVVRYIYCAETRKK